MIKKALLLLLLLAIKLGASAGEFEDALSHNDKIFLYMYTNSCGYCDKFQPIYTKISSKYPKACRFLKIDANTPYGSKLMNDLNARYVPYVVLIDVKKQTLQQLVPNCLIDYSCTKDAVQRFLY